MKKSCIFLALLCSLTLSGLGITYAQLALGGGYQCVLLLTNKTEVAWNGSVRLRSGNGEKWTRRWFLGSEDMSGLSEFSVAVPARGTAKFVLSSIDAEAEAGYLEIVTQSPGSGEGDLAVSFFYNFLINDRLVDSTGVPPSRQNQRFVLPVERSARVNTGFAWAPFLKPGPFEVTLTLLDPSGKVLERQTVTFNGHWARFFTEVFEGVPDPFLGAVLFEAQESIYLTALRLEFTDTGFQLTGIQPES